MYKNSLFVYSASISILLSLHKIVLFEEDFEWFEVNVNSIYLLVKCSCLLNSAYFRSVSCHSFGTPNKCLLIYCVHAPTCLILHTYIPSDLISVRSRLSLYFISFLSSNPFDSILPNRFEVHPSVLVSTAIFPCLLLQSLRWFFNNLAFILEDGIYRFV